METKDWLSIGQIFVTFLLGCAAAYYARAQWEANKSKVLLELFKERFEIYTKLEALIK